MPVLFYRRRWPFISVRQSKTKAEAPTDQSKDPAGLVNVLPAKDPAKDPFADTAPTTDPGPIARHERVVAGGECINAGTLEIQSTTRTWLKLLRMLSLQSHEEHHREQGSSRHDHRKSYDVTVREALDALMATNGYRLSATREFHLRLPAQRNSPDMDKAARVVKTQAFRLYYTPAANAVTMIKPVLSNEAQVAFTTPGGERGWIPARKTLAAARTRPKTSSSLPTIRKISSACRRSSRKSTAARSKFCWRRRSFAPTLNEDNALGVYFTLLGNVDFSTLNNAGTSAAAALSGAITAVADGERHRR